jgi:hypothetical protein
MTLRDTSTPESYIPDTVWPFASAPEPPAAAARRGRARRPNYRAVNRPATERRAQVILRLLALAPVGFTVADVGVALGISRQLALYHVKKLAAAGRLTMMLEPCARNGGLQYAVWDTAHLARDFAARASRAPARRRAAA